MAELTTIKGGAGEVEAAVIAAVIDRILKLEKLAASGRGETTNAIPAWVRAIRPTPVNPLDIHRPE